MAVVPMSLVSVYGLKKDRKAILEALQRYGVLEIKKQHFDGMTVQDTAASQLTFKKAAQTAEDALGILEQTVHEKTSVFESLSGKKDMPPEVYYKLVGEVGEIMRVAGEIVRLSKENAEGKAEISRLESQIESLLPWKDFDLPLNFSGTQKTAAFVGTVPGQMTAEQLIERYKGDNTELDVVSSSPEQTCIFAVCPKDAAEECENNLRALGFSSSAVSSNEVPAVKIGQLREKIGSVQKRAEKNLKEIAGYEGMRNALRFASDYYTMRADKYEVLGSACQSKNAFAITGYAPEKTAKTLEAVLSKKYNAAVEVEKPDGDEPVLLHNNSFAAPAESVVEAFSMPGAGEGDPTPIMSIFYYVLFGLMLSDFAYGLIMAIGCFAAIHKFKNMDSGLKKTLKLFMYCGVSTAFWGLMFGSCFGDAVTVISSTFFGKTVNFPALWFEPLDDVMKMLLFSFAVGIVHLFTGLAVKLYDCVKRGEVLDGIYDVVFWYFLVGGGIVYLLSTEMVASMFSLNPLPHTVGRVSAALACIGALGIVIFAGRSSKNPLKRLAKGLYELYNVTGYLSDLLSYSRLLALSLATGVISQVFNKMGTMLGGGFVGAAVFIVVFVLGHTLNIGINLLGAYVHTNRLQFVEFFGKFYEGGGRKYQPFSENTKYFKIREDV